MSISSLHEAGHDLLGTGALSRDEGTGRTEIELHGLNLSGFFRIVSQQWPLILGVTLAAVLAALVYSVTATSKYTASSKIMVNPQPKRVFGSDYIPQDGNTNQVLIESQTRVIESNAVLNRVIDEEHLIDDPEFVDDAGFSLKDWLGSLLGLTTASDQLLTEDEKRQEALRRLQDKLAVKRPSQTYVIEVSVSAEQAEKAARLSRAIARAYIADQAESQSDATRRIADLLQDRLATLRGKVMEADSRVQAFKEQHNIVSTEGSLVNERHLSRLNDELMSARERMSQAEAKMEKARSFARTGTLPDTIDAAINSRVIATLREQYARAARRESQLATIYGSRHPQLIAARAEVSQARSLINAELERIAQSLQSDYEVEKRRVDALETRIEKSRAVTDLTNKARVELDSLEREANASRAVYDQVLAKARESNAEEKINLIDARIISYATAPLWASWPKKRIILPLALLLGLGFGLAGAIVNDHRRDRFTNAGEMATLTGLPLLGSVPAIARRSTRSLGGLLGRGEDSSSYYRLYLELSKVGSAYATAVMGLVRNLAGPKNEQKGKTIMLVSTMPQEGSSSIAWSTAISAAMLNRKVLLIDGDGGNGELTETLAPDADDKIAAVVSAKAQMSDLIVEDRKLGLSFLPLVPTSSKAAEIGWHDYRSLLARVPEVARMFDLVVIDGGAINNSGLAHLLVEYVDEVALVIRSDETSRKDVLEGLKTLDAPQGKLRGVIASMVDPETI